MIDPVSSQAQGRPRMETGIDPALKHRPHSRACEEIKPQTLFVPH